MALQLTTNTIRYLLSHHSYYYFYLNTPALLFKERISFHIPNRLGTYLVAQSEHKSMAISLLHPSEC